MREGIGPHAAAQLQRDRDFRTVQPALSFGQLVKGDTPVRAVAQFGHTLTVDQNQLCHRKALPKGAPTGLVCCSLTPAHRVRFTPSMPGSAGFPRKPLSIAPGRLPVLSFVRAVLVSVGFVLLSRP